MFNIRQIPSTISTNDDTKAAAESGEAEGLVIWALAQTGGRGRRGRVWVSPEGNLHVSLLLRPRCDLRQVGHYGYVAALAVHDVVQALLPHTPVTLKWPNDVLACGHKICGILLDAAPVKNGLVEWLVVGIGLNVEHHPDLALYPATSLRAAGITPPSLQHILENLLASLWRWKETLETDGFSTIRTAWLANAHKGELKVCLPDRNLEGEFAGIDDNGNLLLLLADGTKKAIATGDVFFAH